MSKFRFHRDKLPDESIREMDFLDSSFFKEPRKCLPTPAQVRALSSDSVTGPQPRPVIFKDSNLLVKFGPSVNVAEAQSLWMIKRVFGDKIPVPEVFGWRVDEDNFVFIYMELIQGQTLLDRWSGLDSLDKTSVCDQLRAMLDLLRRLQQNPSDHYIGSLNYQRLHDYVFQFCPEAGPFSSVREFNDWFSCLPQSHLPPSSRYKDPYRYLLPDDDAIAFTHGDLHRGNIIVSSSNPVRILAIVDWAHAGWYPDYWEYCKALYTCWYEDEWRVCIDQILGNRMLEFTIFAEYTMAMGAV